MGYLIRIAVILLALWLVIRFIKRWLARHEDADAPKISSENADKMLACEHCGVYVPASQALKAAGKAYCSQQHLLADQAKKP